VYHHGKLTLATLTATITLAAALTATAAARSFSFSNWNFRVVWTSIEFTNNTGFGTVRCPVTLEGSFHSQTISKVEHALIGQVSRATVAEASCTAGPVTVKQESLPWHITYNGFRGILPAIKGIRIFLLGPTFDIRGPFGEVCHARTDPEHQTAGEGIIGAGEIQNVVPDQTPEVPTNNCVTAAARFRAGGADGTATLLGNTTRIRITLI